MRKNILAVIGGTFLGIFTMVLTGESDLGVVVSIITTLLLTHMNKYAHD